MSGLGLIDTPKTPEIDEVVGLAEEKLDSYHSLPAEVLLPPILDLKAATLLKSMFMSQQRTAIRVNAADVRRLGAQCLQVLLAARAQWAADNIDFQLYMPSADFMFAMGLFGLSADEMRYEGRSDT